MIFRFLWRQLYRLALHRGYPVICKPTRFQSGETGWVAAIPFPVAVGMRLTVLLSIDWRKRLRLAKTRKTAIVCGLMMSALGVAGRAIFPRQLSRAFYLNGAILRAFLLERLHGGWCR